MNKYTENELAMLRAFYNESMDVCGSCDENENLSYMNASDLLSVLGGTKQSIGGTMSSLLDKGAICDTGESARYLKINDFVICDYEICAEFAASEIDAAKQSCTMVSLESVIEEAKGLWEGTLESENPEYFRGMCELIARCFPALDVMIDERADQIAMRILD